MRPRDIFTLLKDAFSEWSADKAPRLGAAVAYYTVFSLAPLLVVVIAIAGLVFGEKAVRGELVGQIQGMVGPDAAQTIQTMIAGANKPAAGIIATIIGLVTLLLGASGLFGELQDALNTVWEIAPKPKSILATIRARVLSFGLVLVVGFLLLVSLVLSAGIAVAGQLLGSVLPVPEVLLHLINFVVSFAVITLLFGLIYKILPDAVVAWRDVWIGAAVTSLLFAIGKLAIGLYLGHSGTSSTYGAAGSLVVLLLWVYYSAQILFFGAEFTQVYANRYGSKIKPAADAMTLEDQMRARDLRPDAERSETPATKRTSAATKPAAGRATSDERRVAAIQRGESRVTFGVAVALGIAFSAVKGLRALGRHDRGSGSSRR